MSKSTIYDVATSANVSPATVSRFLNQKANVDAEKAQRIERAIASLNYTPRRRRKGQRAMKIGVIAPTFDSPFVSDILTGIDLRSQSSGYQLQIETSSWRAEEERKHLIAFHEQGLDGVILLVGVLAFEEVKSILNEVPALFVCRGTNDLYPVIWSNNVIGGMMATNHLLQLGHTQIAHLVGSQKNFDSRDRLQGFRQSIHQAGLVQNLDLVVGANFSLEGGYQATVSLLKRGLFFSAIFAANDLSAFGAISALNDNGLKVPEDVSVIGFDDHIMCQYSVPKLTTVKQPLVDIGVESLTAMINILNNKHEAFVTPTFEVVSRASTSAYVSCSGTRADDNCSV